MLAYDRNVHGELWFIPEQYFDGSREEMMRPIFLQQYILTVSHL